MALIKVLFVCSFLALVALCYGEGDEVKVEIMTPAPADCVRKTKQYDHLTIHYVGTITATGVKFDSSHDRGRPYHFQLGMGQVIRGYEEGGVLDMCVGEKRKLIMPSSKAYGTQGVGEKIPPNAGLTFEVELVEIQPVQVLVTDKVTWEVSIGEKTIGNIVIGVFGNVVPITAKNFVELSSGVNGYGYSGSAFHRVIQGFMLQGGDYDKKDGSGIKSIYGGYFDDENFNLKHLGPGYLSMANAGKDTNGCQFFITLVPTPWLDGSHTVFGKVLEGMDVVQKMGKTPTGADDLPLEKVVITKSSAEKVTEKLYVDLISEKNQ